MNILEVIKGKPIKVKHGNGGKVTYQYADEVPDLANPVARVVRTDPRLRQRAMQTNKKIYDRKKLSANVMKEMNECALILHEAAVHNLVPALKIVQPNGAVQIVRGRPGQTHADIWEPLDASGRVPEDANVDGGFFDTRRKRYLSRVEATRLISGDPSASNQLDSLQLKAQQAHY